MTMAGSENEKIFDRNDLYGGNSGYIGCPSTRCRLNDIGAIIEASG
jgi:hypothetical protein